MAFTNSNTRATSAGAGDMRGDLSIRNCLRASFRPEAFVLTHDEEVYLTTGMPTGFGDNIPRVCIVTVKEDDDASVAGNTQTAIVTFFQDDVTVEVLLGTGTDIIAGGGTDATAAATANTVVFGFDANGDADGSGCFYVNSGFATTSAMVSITRIDGFTEDLLTLTA